MIKKFIKINQDICNRVEGFLPHTKPDITETYSRVVSEYANKQKNLTIVDIGGGRFTPFAKLLNSKNKQKLIVIDENKTELEKNHQAEKIIADVNKIIPLKTHSTDMIVSRYTLEHLNNIPDFLSNSKKTLKEDGLSIHLFSCKFAPFAVFNQLLPQKASKYLLNSFLPDSKDIHGFKTNYNYCYYDSILNIFERNNFNIEKIYLSYYQSRYFSFFLPFYIISVLYELVIYSLNLKNLSAYILIVARNNGD